MLVQPALPSAFAAPSSSCMNKLPHPTHLYIHPQHTVEIIQLIEVPPPPPRSHPYTSTLASSSFASSSGSSDDDSEEDESVCSSYCSSEEDLAQEHPPVYDDTYKTRLNRVLAWREGFVKATAGDMADDGDSISFITAPPSSPVSSSPAHSLKRKADDDDAPFDSDDETSSQSSKRSRSLPPEPLNELEEIPAWQQRQLSAHSCSACDACFATVQSLRQHGKESGRNDACREAVEYGFES